MDKIESELNEVGRELGSFFEKIEKPIKELMVIEGLMCELGVLLAPQQPLYKRWWNSCKMGWWSIRYWLAKRIYDFSYLEEDG